MGKRADKINETDPLDARSPAPLPIELEEPLAGASDVEGAYDPVTAAGGVTSAWQTDVYGDALEEAEPQAASGENEDIVIAQAEIEETREQMSETIDAIQEKLSPEHLKEQVTESVKQATVGRAIGLWGTVRRTGTDAISKVPDAAKTVGAKAAQTAQQKPIPVAAVVTSLIALVVGARMVRARRLRPTAPPPSNPSRAGQALSQGQQALSQVASQAQSSAARLTSRAQDRVTQLNTKRRIVRARTLRPTAPPPPNPSRVGQAQQALSQVAAQAQRSAGRLTSRTQDRVTQLNTKRRTQGPTATSSTQRGLLDTRLTVIDLIAGIGVSIALAILRRRQRVT